MSVSGSAPAAAPQKKGTPWWGDTARIRKPVKYRRLAEYELVSAVIDAMRHSASIHETGAIAQTSARTLLPWRVGQGVRRRSTT